MLRWAQVARRFFSLDSHISAPMVRVTSLFILVFTFSCSLQDRPEASDIFKLKPVSVEQVRLLDGPFKDAMTADKKWLLDLVPDRLLHRYLVHAGLEPKGEIYGGWESRGISGHSLGHYISACALMFAASGETIFKDRVAYIVRELKACQDARKTGYIGAIPDEDRVWDEIASGDIRSQGFDLNGLWVPWYTQHKLLAGLIDAYKLTGDQLALDVAKKFSDWIDTKFANLTDDQFQRMLDCEFGGMNDALAQLYDITGDKRYLRLAQRFYHEEILDPLVNQTDHLAGKHANTQVPKIVGAAKTYELTGNPKDSTVAAYFLRKVLADHSYVNGGNSEHEHFGEPGKLAHRLSESTSETCNTYNMLKLANHVQSWEFDGRWGDYTERALLNHILASQNPNDGMVCYFVPLHAGGRKTYSDPFESFWCCVGSGWENHAKYGGYIYFETLDGQLVIDQFISNELKLNGLELKMTTEFPEKGVININLVKVDRPLEKIFIRRPNWSTGYQVFVNGQNIEPTTENGYLVLKSNWKNNDQIKLSLGMQVTAESMPDDNSLQAIFYGPTLLAGVIPEDTDPLDYPVFVTDKEDASDWVKMSSRSFAGVSQGTGKPDDIIFRPFYSLLDEKYVVYLETYDQKGWEARKAMIATEKEARLALERRTMDILRIGEMQPERDHELRGENTISGEAFNRKWRHAEDGWFSFKMAVDKQASNELMVTYWGGDAGNREFDILVDDQQIARQKLERNQPDEFYDEVYPIPSSLTQGKKQVVIRFQSLPGKTAGGVYGCRTLRGE